MKDIYSLLNDVETNISSYAVEELTDGEKRKMLKKINQILGNDKGSTTKRRNYAAIAACAATIILIAGTINFNDAVYATAKNIAWQIGDFLGVGKDLQDYTTVIGTEKTDKGYTIKLNEIILDENQLIVSSAVRSQEKLSVGGLMPFAEVYVNGKKVSVAAGGGSKFIDDYTEESVLDYELEGIDTNGRLDIELIYTGILKDNKETRGKWGFHFEADGAKLAMDTTRIALNNSFPLPNGSKLVLTEYTSNDLGQKIYYKVEDWEYEKNPMYDLKLEGQDSQGSTIAFDMSCFDGKEKRGRLNVRRIDGVVPEQAKWIRLKAYAVEMPKQSGKMSHDYVEIGDSFTIDLLEK
ncbi:DUF4179 domain-containing protein [Aminipila sp.]|uniref:DUF4179 domain-containing protein n=1 Tax=Aminipila sp. TaxID=2060095 RepID=UPI0028986B40|nr:DUF4179 domain-containing protein [Aminipila sp.]